MTLDLQRIIGRRLGAVLASGALLSTLVGAVATGHAGSPHRASAAGLHVALVRQLCAGDFFAQWLSGAQAEAKALGISLTTSCANGNDAQMAADGRTAVTQGADGIIFDHGFQQTLQPVVTQALNANIPLVAFDLGTTDPRVTTIDQNDLLLGLTIDDYLVTDQKGKAAVGLVHAGGFLPLDKRKAEWDSVLHFFPGIKQVATWGTVSAATVSAVQNETVAALTAHPEITAILAPYDAFALGATNAVLQTHRNVRVYGADISTADIQTITKAGSPWVATAATDPYDVGVTAVRAIALKALHKSVPQYVAIPPTLITQSFLRSHHVQNMADLDRALPGFANTNALPRP